MSSPKVLQNAFDTKTLNQLIRKFQFVGFDQSPQNVMKELEEVTPNQYLWAVCKDPAYFVQYQHKSVALIKVKNYILIVWKPKYIEYPAMNQLPKLSQKKLNNLKIQFLPQTKTTTETNGYLTTFLEGFYAQSFHTDPEFETKLITSIKHLISRVTNHSYWHAIMDKTGSVHVTQIENMMNVCKIRVSGVKEGYDKTIFLFAMQGQRINFFAAAKHKWIQLLSFLSMCLIFYSITACSAESNEGICAYRNEMSMLGVGVMLSLIGVRFIKDKKKNKKTMGKVNPEKKFE